jgi:tetratricopeptide (TPR) repeat protein
MRRGHWFCLLLLFALALTAAVALDASSQIPPLAYPQIPPLPYDHKAERIAVGGNAVEVRHEDVDRWRRRISKPARPPAARTQGDGALSAERVKALAGKFGLTERTETNPSLVFVDKDIIYWRDRRLDEGRLELEFAARRLILEAADRQRVKIPDKETLSKAAQQLIPVLEKARDADIADTINSVVCKGDTSQEFTPQAWQGLKGGDFALAMACTNGNIKKWSRQADAQQAKASEAGCSDTPQPTNLKPYSAANWALSDIAVSWFIQGEVYSQQGKWPEARTAYKTVIDKYPCAFAWDPRGWFWRVADSAQERYDDARLR